MAVETPVSDIVQATGMARRPLAGRPVRNEALEADVYAAIADMLPREGRDYEVSFRYERRGDMVYPSVRISPVTVMGEEWCRHVTAGLPERVSLFRRGVPPGSEAVLQIESGEPEEGFDRREEPGKGKE